MQDAETSRTSATVAPQSKATGDAALKAIILDELGKILSSAAFVHSHQSQRLLRHLVEHSLEGRFEDLRERVIGVELFGREAGFDTNDDPIVRVRATEVRKRLARYYEALKTPPPLRLELPAGAYRVEFREPAAPVPAASEPQPPAAPERARRWLLLAAAGIAVIAAAVILAIRAPRPIDAFWQPLLATNREIIVCTGHPLVYRFSREFLRQRAGQGLGFLQKQIDALPLAPDEKISGRDIVPIPDQYIGLGSAHATARISSWLTGKGQRIDIRFGDDISFTDLKQSPAVLVSFANRWTVDFLGKFRFTPELDEEGRSLILDRTTGKKWLLPGLQEDGRTDEDYVLVTRTFYSESGQCLIAVAGLTQYGTQAAGDIITDPQLLEPALAQAEPGWQKRNLQLLFHVRVVNHTPGPPRLIAVHAW